MAALPLEALPAPALAALVRELRSALTRAEARIAALAADLTALRGGGPPAPPAPPAPPRKTPANSSVPPAKGWKARRSDPPAGTARPKRGRKLGQPGRSRRRVDAAQVAVIVPCRPRDCGDCGHCGAVLADQGGTVVAQRQVTAIPPLRPVVVEAQCWRVRCRRCGHGTVGASPDGFGGTRNGDVRSAVGGDRRAAR